MKKLILIGGGGHCKSCIDVIEQEGVFEIAGILDVREHLGKKILDYKIIGTDEDIEQYARKGYVFLIAVGQIKSADIRQKLFSKLNQCHAKMATVISPRSYVSKHASVGDGTIVMHDALVNASATVGDNCIINTKALIEHDSIIENFCHISTSAVINGGSVIKAGTFIGSNAVGKEGLVVEKDSFIKAGSLNK